MPNYKIFQDVPDQARVKIYGVNNLAVNQDASGNVGITSLGLAVTAPANGLLVTGVLATAMAITDVSTTRANITNTSGTPDTAYNVLGINVWTLSAINASTVANAQAVVKLQTSPDASTWQDDPSGSVTINQNSLASFVSTVFLKYARLYYSAVNAASSVTLNIFFQGQI